MDERVEPLAAIFDLNTDLLTNCVLNLSDSQANERLPGGGNSIAFLVAHLADARHFLAEMLDAPLPNPIGAVLADVQTIEDVKAMPPLTELLDAWRRISTHLSLALRRATATQLDAASKHDFPIAGNTVRDAVAFLAQHDSYHLGQISFVRRQLGLPAMVYDRPSRGGAG